MTLAVGQRVWFREEKLPYTVQAVSARGRYAALTKPFAARKTVLYSMVDLVAHVRGVDNSMGNSLGYESREDCEENVALFEAKRYEFSHRRRPIPLDIVRTQ